MLDVELGRIRLRNPILTASGTFGFGKEFEPFVNLGSLGGIVTKTLYLERRRGNPPPRIVELPGAGGMLNSIGLENPGCDAFERQMLPGLVEKGVTVIVSCAGERPEDFARVAERVDRMEGIAAIEMNLSCPNVKKGGLDLGTDPERIHAILRQITQATEHPIIAKLTPNVTDIKALAQAAVDGGAEALSLINTLAGMAIDWRTRRSKLGTKAGGLSGPAIKPVALRMVYEASRQVSVPIIGIGGITCAEDVLEFLVLGASAVQVGTANFYRPPIAGDIVEELRELLRTEGIDSVREVIGTFVEPDAIVREGQGARAEAASDANAPASAGSGRAMGGRDR